MTILIIILVIVGVFALMGLILFFFLKTKFMEMLNSFGLGGVSIEDAIREARLQDEDQPKSLSGMDSVYLEQIRKDFPEVNINELKRETERIILDCYRAIEEKDSSKFKGKIASFIQTKIHDLDTDISFKDFMIHNTVLSRYKKEEGLATIYFSTSFQYYINNKKIQDRCKTEFIYVYDTSKVDEKRKVLGLNCPNCGSPITSLGQKKCSYCSTSVVDVVKRVFVCNDIVQY